MKIVQIIMRSANADEVEIVEQAFHEAGLETNLIRLGEDRDRNARLLVGMCDDDAAHPTEVWLLPAAAVDMMVIDQDRAAAARSFIGFQLKSDFQRKLLITTDQTASEAPNGAITFSVADLQNRKIGLADLRAYFD
jgi:hypothetical protein